MIELYEAYADYHDIMDLTESMVRHIAQEVFGSAKVSYNDEEIDLESSGEDFTLLMQLKKPLA